MLDRLDQQPPDALLALIKLHDADPRGDKIDLGVGVYRTGQGATPVFGAIKAAERKLVEEQDTKAYLGPEGDMGFVHALMPYVFGEDPTRGGRIEGMQTPGGTGAVRLALALAKRAGVTRVLIQAQNNPGATARVGLIETPLFAGLLWLGIDRYGLPGAAAAVLARALFDYLVLLYLARIQARTILVDMFAYLSFLAAALAIAWWLPGGAIYAIGAGVVLSLANAVWSVASTPILRGYARSLLFRLNSRKSA